MIYILTNLEIEQEYIEKLIKFIVFAGIIQAVIGIFQSIFPNQLYDFFAPGDFSALETTSAPTIQDLGSILIRGTLTRYTNFGDYICIVALVFWGYSRLYKYKYTNIFKAIFILALILSATRSSITMFILGILIYAYFDKKNYKYLAIFFAIPIIIFTGEIIGNISGENPLQRFYSLADKGYQYSENRFSSGSRFVVIKYVPEEMVKLPINSLVGFSPGSFKFGDRRANILQNKLNLDTYFHLHDVFWIQLLVSLGIIGLLIWILFLKKSMMFRKSIIKGKEGQNIKNVTLQIAFVLMIALIAFNFFGEYFEVRETSFYPWLFVAMSLNIYKNHKNNNE